LVGCVRDRQTEGEPIGDLVAGAPFEPPDRDRTGLRLALEEAAGSLGAVPERDDEIDGISNPREPRGDPACLQPADERRTVGTALAAPVPDGHFRSIVRAGSARNRHGRRDQEDDTAPVGHGVSYTSARAGASPRSAYAAAV